MDTAEKIGTYEWHPIRRTGVMNYIRLKRSFMMAFNLKRGDLLLVKIEKVIKKQTKEEN